MKNSVSVLAVCALAGATLAAGPVAAAEKGAAYFKGKTLTWIVGRAPGGGHDFFRPPFFQAYKKGHPGH